MRRAAVTCSVSAGAPGFWMLLMTTGFLYDNISVSLSNAVQI